MRRRLRTRERTARARRPRLIRRAGAGWIAWPALAARAFERGAIRFNHCEAGRTVAGLTRTLGAPKVSVGAAGGSASEVRVTVAWELTWYQWGVDLGDEARPVFALGKGGELISSIRPPGSGTPRRRRWPDCPVAPPVARGAADQALRR